MTRIITICALALLTGCSTTGAIQTPPSRVTCTLAADAGYVVSFFRFMGYTLKIAMDVDMRDVVSLCPGGNP